MLHTECQQTARLRGKGFNPHAANSEIGTTGKPVIGVSDQQRKRYRRRRQGIPGIVPATAIWAPSALRSYDPMVTKGSA